MSKLTIEPQQRPPTTRSSSQIWRPVSTRQLLDFKPLRDAVKNAALPNSQLLELSARHSPPESWWEEKDDPFAPDG